jgi:hypothetical protein
LYKLFEQLRASFWNYKLCVGDCKILKSMNHGTK